VHCYHPYQAIVWQQILLNNLKKKGEDVDHSKKTLYDRKKFTCSFHQHIVLSHNLRLKDKKNKKME
jgi:hypothetical protein